jgi:hypothetical protein
VCKKTYFGTRKDAAGGARPVSYIDPCIRNLIEALNEHGIETVASCCGHNVYPMTIICKSEHGDIYDLMTDLPIFKKRNFYKRDKDGYYYVPEVLEHLELKPNL